MLLLISSKFYIKNKLFVWFFIVQINLFNTKICIFFAFIKFDKWVNMTGPFNKQIVLELRNLDPFNKCVGLVLTHIVKYS